VISDAVRELCAELEKAGVSRLQPATTDDLELAASAGFPRVLVDFYREGAADDTNGMIELDQRIWSVQNAVAENKDYVPGAYLFPLGYVVFASNKFGDAYCLDTVHPDASGEHPVVLFPHDVIEEESSLQDVELYRLIVAKNLEDFVRQFTLRTLIERAKYN
jgi:hypothetical protein